MKFTNTRAFIKHLTEAAPDHFSPFYMVIAREEAERKEVIRNLVIALLGSKAVFDHALKVVEGEEITARDLLDELQTNSLFASRRVLHLYQVDKLKDSVIEQLENYFTDPQPSLFLVLSTAAIHRGSSFYKKTEKAGIILDIEEQKPWEKTAALVQYAEELFSREGLSFDHQLCLQIVERTGSQKLLLEQEIEKLICYMENRRQITQKDLEAVSVSTSNENGWQLGDAIFRRDTSAAIRIIQTLLEQEGSIIGLLRQLRGQFQVKYQVNALLASGGGSYEIQQKFPYMKGNILQQNIQAVQGYGSKELKKGILLIDETELLAKSSGMAENLLADRLIFKLTL
jgi:DNA polymerase-3 subunit delta